jgi:type VI secretion system protein ImpE
VNIRLEAVNRLREKNHAAALELLTKANAAVPEMRGTLNDKPCQGLRDADDLFAGMFEAFAHGKYFWVPFEQVESIAMKAPRFPRDILWVPARLETKDSAGDVFLPALYPNSHLAQDDQLRLGRSTDWSSDNNGPTLGVGLRLFLVGEDAVNLLEWRELKLES